MKIWWAPWYQSFINTLKPRQNGRHFADDTFKCIFLNENEWTSLKISLTFVPNVRINNIPALVQIMAWRRPGDKPLSEPMIDYRRIYASLGLNELTHRGWDKMAATWTDDIFKCTFVKEKISVSIKIPLNFVPKGPIDKKWSLVQERAWCLVLVTSHYRNQWWPSSMTHICITRPQWVNKSRHHIDGLIEES